MPLLLGSRMQRMKSGTSLQRARCSIAPLAQCIMPQTVSSSAMGCGEGPCPLGVPPRDAGRSASRMRRGAPRCGAAPAVATPAAEATAVAVVHLPAQVVGWVVIAGSCVRSVPQIMRITKNKSVAGISLLSFASELAAFLITIAYNVHFSYPLSTWGETLTNAVQHAILVGLIFFYNEEVPLGVKALIVLGLSSGATFLLSPMCGDAMLRWLQSLVIIILAVLGRVPQVVLNHRRGNSGELSFGSTLLSVIGNACRVYTTLALVKDPIIMATAVSQLFLNSTLLYQIFDTVRQNKNATGKWIIL